MMPHQGPALIWLLLGCTLLVGARDGTASSSSTAPPRSVEALTVNWNLGTKGIQYADIYAAIEKGLFKDQQIEVALTASSNSPGTLLISGAAQISSGQPTVTYVADAQGADLVAIYSPASTYEVWVAKPGVAGPQHLAGKTIGVFSLQDLDVVYTRQMMQQVGLKPASYTLLATGPTNNKLAAVVAGHVDAAPLYPPANFVAQQQGLVEIFNTTQLTFGQVPTFYVVRRGWAEQHKVGVINLIRALNKAHDWLFNPANKSQVIEILAKYTAMAPELVAKSYDLYFTKAGTIYSKNGEWDPQVVKKTGDELVTLGLLSAPPPKYEATVAPEYREQALKGP
jgi:ABC-type nitrate/sulfonate/bicarbonate transport system substrate-binding protein